MEKQKQTKLPVVVESKPVVVELAPGQYAWCSCGLSMKQPFCDGTHHDTGFKSVKFQIEQKQKVALCNCKRTGNPPFCDGSHGKL